MATTSRGYRKVADSELDKAQAVNDALEDVDADVAGVAATAMAADAKAQAALDDGSNGGKGADKSMIGVPVNTDNWTDTSIALSGTDALSIRASGSFRFSAGNPLLDVNAEGGAYLYFCVVPDGQVPTGDMDGQFIYAEQRAIVGQIGRVFARIRDVGGASDNTGDVTLSLLHHADAATAFAQLSHSHNLSDVRGLEAALANSQALNNSNFFVRPDGDLQVRANKTGRFYHPSGAEVLRIIDGLPVFPQGLTSAGNFSSSSLSANSIEAQQGDLRGARIWNSGAVALRIYNVSGLGVEIGGSTTSEVKILSRSIHKMPETAPADASIAPGQTQQWFDPTTNEIVTRGCKLSGAYWTRREAVVMD